MHYFKHDISPVISYRVRVGHAEVTVRSQSQEEAIRLARRQLCAELPRLWDVIHRLEDAQFRVDLAHEILPPKRIP
ncbi:MAG: hypothetical protein KF708_09200 [Pirellulales bacterium]|nr:hypothetical protein [Pirellulales bacterium]